MPITPLPTPVPSRTDPANFAARGDAFLAALPTFATEANALEANVDAAEAVCLSAAQTVNVTAWNSGTSYVIGVNVYDATTLLTYRRKTVGSGGLRPGLNSTDWQLLTGFGNVDLASTQTLTNKTHGAGSVWAGGVIPIANGGTGQNDAGAAFAALKQSATESASGVLEIATAAESQALSDNTLAITPARLATALQGANQSLAATGYQRLPGGVIVQWGNVSAVFGANTVTYAIAFPNSAYIVVATAGGNNGGNNTTSYVDGITLTNFNLVNATGTTNNWKYIAIGR